jgi:hypothetical protein
MGPEGSLPCSQEPSTCPYPEPDESSPFYPSLFLTSILLVSAHVSLGLPVVSYFKAQALEIHSAYCVWGKENTTSLLIKKLQMTELPGANILWENIGWVTVALLSDVKFYAMTWKEREWNYTIRHFLHYSHYCIVLSSKPPTRNGIFFPPASLLGSSLPYWSTGLITQFLDLFAGGRTPWTSNELVGRPLPKHRTTQTQKIADTH